MIKVISDIGLKSSVKTEEIKQIRLTNWLAFLSVIISIVYLLVFLSFGVAKASYVEVIAIVFYISVLVLARFQLFLSCRFLFIITLFLHMVARSLCYGEASQIHLLLIPIATIPLILYNLKQRVIIFTLVLIGIGAFLFLYLSNFESSLHTELPQSLIQIIRFTSYLTAISTQGGVMFDIISNYEKNEKVLDESNVLLQQQFQAIFENSYDALFLVDWDERRIIKANQRAAEMFEFNTPEDFYYRFGTEFHASSNPEELLGLIRNQLNTDGKYEGEIHYKTEKGNLFWGAIAVIVIKIGGRKYQSVRITDISDKKKIKLQLEASLNEKQTLLAEIHHRVKNNMAVISGLLSLQANYVDDEKSKILFKESCNRIHSMAMVHDKLYHNETFANIDFGTYINDLIRHIKASHADHPTEVTYSVNCTKVLMDMKFAVPCGLILNELISNVYKHAFSNMNKGSVVINCSKVENNFFIRFSDNGKGFDSQKVLSNLSSLGLGLITALVDQIDGKLEISHNNGTTFDLSFKG